MKRVHIICPATGLTDEQSIRVTEHYNSLIEKNIDVYDPRVDDAKADNEIELCQQHLASIKHPRNISIDVFWSKNSRISYFDLGLAFATNAQINLIEVFDNDNEDDSYLNILKEMKGKHYNRKLIELDGRKHTRKFSYDKGEYLDDYPALILESETYKLQEEIKLINLEQEKIYKNCDHEYHKTSHGGGYEDPYTCIHCYHTEWR